MSSLPAFFAAATIASASGGRERDGLLDEDVLAGLERCNAIGACWSVTVQMSMRSMSGSASSSATFAYFFTPERSTCPGSGPKLPRVFRQSPASLAGSRLHIAATFAPVEPLRGEIVDAAHEADADDADANHLPPPSDSLLFNAIEGRMRSEEELLSNRDR